MMREGILDEYRSYDVSVEIETLWLCELVDLEYTKLDINSFDSFFPL